MKDEKAIVKKNEENKLLELVKESGLEKTKAQVLLDNFSDYFKIAGEWETKAKAIIVSNESQTAEMQMARTGRLFLREKRIAIEKTRKELKEQSLREGKAIDGIANVLKALIIPIEEYLGNQERFVEIKKAEEAERKRLEIEEKIEAERIAKEKAEREEQERIRIENERLRKEAEVKEKQMEEEREKARKANEEAERKIREEREKAAAKQHAFEEKVRKEKEIAEETSRQLREEQERRIAEQEAKARAEKERAERIEREKKEAEEKARLELEKEKAKLVVCPFCHRSFRLEANENILVLKQQEE